MNREEYYDRVYGCWLGKNIGGTMGVPYEGNKDFLSLPLKEPDEILANDDLDLQLVWLDILKKKGIRITSADLAEGWLNNINYPFDEYGVAIANLKAGLKPPVTGYYNNWFKNGMGAPIRSEIWASIAPGRPEVAGWYAYQDASVDHWDEGVYGEIFLAVLESLAFSDGSLPSLIKTSLSFVPKSCRVHQAVELTLSLYRQGKDLRDTRKKILQQFGHHNFTDCVQNIAFTIAGLLYGEGNLLKTIVSAINCGYDTDCTGATAGAIAGILLGKEKILKESVNNINEKIVAGWGIKNIDIPPDVKHLTEQVTEIGKQLMGEENLPRISKPFRLTEIPPFSPPLKFPFSISHPFSLNGAMKMEKSILSGEYKNWNKEIFTDFYFNLNRYFKGNEPQSIFLRTSMNVDNNRKIKLFPACSEGVKMWADRKLLLSYQGHNEFLPAPHRPGSPLAEVEIKKGRHDILLEITRINGKVEFAWLAADEKNHLVTDMKFEDS